MVARQLFVQLLLAAAVAFLMRPSTTRAQSVFVEDFADDPVAAGRLHLHDGSASRFVYDSEDHTLLAHYDTMQSTARLIRPICPALTEADTFTFSAVFRIRSEGFWASPDSIAQIAFGLMSTTATGPDRVDATHGAGAYEVVSFDYFPNITSFGGPSAGPTMINRDTGIGFVNATTINFEFGPETQMDDDGEGPLPLDQWLTAEVRYDGPTRQARLRIFGDEGPLPINMRGSRNAQGNRIGGSDGDTTTIISHLTGAGFTVDSFGLLLWADASAGFQVLAADVDFQRISMSALTADFNHDGQVNDADLAQFQLSVTGPAVPQLDPDRRYADLDCDGDVDQDDFGLFQAQIAKTL